TPPGENGATSLIGRVGYAWDSTGPEASAATRPKTRIGRPRNMADLLSHSRTVSAARYAAQRMLRPSTGGQRSQERRRDADVARAGRARLRSCPKVPKPTNGHR